MANFKLEGEETPEPQGQSPSPPNSPPPADEFSYFLDDEDRPQTPPPAVAPPKPAAPSTASPRPQQQAPTPSQPQRPASGAPAAGAGTTPARPQGQAPRPQTPPSNTNAVKAQPDLMRPAQTRPSGPPANPLQPLGLNVPAAQAVTPVVTEPDASAIAQSATPSDDMSSGVQEFGARLAKILDSGEDAFTWVARVALLVAGLSLAVILAALLLGNAASLGQNPGQNPHAADMIKNLVLASKGLAWSIFALGLAMLLIAYDDNRWGAIIAGVGLLFHFVIPLGLRAVLGEKNPALQVMAYQFLTIGRFMIGVGLFKAVIDVGLWAWNLPNQIKSKQSTAGAVGYGNPVDAKQQRVAKQANMFSPCWKLPFCREPIRVLCPAYLARKTCWKFGRGCYCDTEMVGRIVRNEPLEVIKAADTVQSKQPPPCARCYIFIEHQTHKFRMISPLALPSTVLFIFMTWPIYNKLFLAFTSGYTRFFSSFSFSAANLAPDAIKATSQGQAEAAAGALSPEAIQQASSYIIGGMLGFFLLIYVSKFIEWAIFKAKW